MIRCARGPLPIGLAMVATIMPALAAPAMWEVKDDNSSIWLFGSIHVLPEGVEWRTDLFDSVLADADSVYFETDVRPAAVAALGAEAYVRGVYVDGTVLTDKLTDDEEALLREKLAEIGLPMGMILAMKPWMASNTVTASAMAAHGYTGEGVEFLLQPQIDEARMGFFETGSEQLAVLADGSDEEQIQMLTEMLVEVDKLPKLMSKLLSHWQGGTIDVLGDAMLAEMGGNNEAFLERLLFQRNENWIAPLEEMLANDQQNLVIVGAAHLIGEGSVVDLLQQAGYTVERVQ